MLNNLLQIAKDINEREGLNFPGKILESSSQIELLDFVQHFGHPSTANLLKQKQFFNTTSLLLLKLIAEGEIDIVKIAQREYAEREKRNN